MKKTFMKKILSIAIAASCVFGISSVNVSASPWDSGSIGGVSCSANLTADDWSGVASTSTSAVCGHQINIQYTYLSGSTPVTVYGYNSGAGTSLSASAGCYASGKLLCSAYGTHSVYYNQYSWAGHTSIAIR